MDVCATLLEGVLDCCGKLSLVIILDIGMKWRACAWYDGMCMKWKACVWNGRHVHWMKSMCVKWWYRLEDLPGVLDSCSSVVVASLTVCDSVWIGLCMCWRRGGVLGGALAYVAFGGEADLGSVSVFLQWVAHSFIPKPLPNYNVSPPSTLSFRTMVWMNELLLLFKRTLVYLASLTFLGVG